MEIARVKQEVIELRDRNKALLRNLTSAVADAFKHIMPVPNLDSVRNVCGKSLGVELPPRESISSLNMVAKRVHPDNARFTPEQRLLAEALIKWWD